VIGGALSAGGMISWKEFVTPVQAEAVRAFVGERARALKLELDHNAAHPPTASPTLAIPPTHAN
jgi:hypothetical protein